ncbi:hypothetical protein NG895_02005 [Aeoliella sp. ICT_H6.2]|uniref:Uncharacterized protein n=1 Tax=Aeoliella straminimaris TaxID=2954799 RepID=A0A9X2F6H9_9BACT|nr:hypothetical protein [Aeoliella straminimaris]MCO6042669.1 hypothetical protein [Aeoliella straminimaris]
MAKKKATSPLTRNQKLFQMPHLYPVDANNLDVDEAMSRLFIYLRTGGRLIRRSDKVVFDAKLCEDAETPKAVLEAVLEENGHLFDGVGDDRRDLLSSWLESHFAIMSRRGKSAGGAYRMAGLRPLHFMVIKLFNPNVKGQDRRLSQFFYNALKDDPTLTSAPDSLMRQFFEIGARRHGDNDYRVDENALKQLATDHKLDIELLFLLRLLQPFDTDKYSTKKDDQVADTEFLCPEQIDLMKQDLKLLFLYKDCIPRRELINYMTTLMVFHAALYFYQIVRIANHMIEHGKLPEPQGEQPQPGDPRSHAPFTLDIFCDMAGGHHEQVDSIAKQRFTEHFKDVEKYFKSAYLMKKLEEFAGGYLTPDQKKGGGKAYIELLLKGYLNHKDIDGYFARDIQAIRQAGYDEESGEFNPDVERIIAICNGRGLNRLQTFVEILYHFQYSTLREQHRKLISGLCGNELDRGFMAGRGRARRKYVIGNELLEVLIQLAALEKRESDNKWQTRPMPIRKFVDWLGGRYGLLIDTLGPNGEESEQNNRALAANYEALKTRLRQLGFFTDLADASNSQVIEPRFHIVSGEMEDTLSGA